MKRLILMLSVGLAVAALQIAGWSGELTVTSPTSRAVFQRNARDFAVVPVVVNAGTKVSRVEVRTSVMSGGSGKAVSARAVAGRMDGDLFRGEMKIPAGGWYTFEIRAFSGRELVGETTIEKVGVGEVFVTAGQSNSTNFGNPRQTPREDRVSALGPNGWQFAADPQPIATDDGAKGGSTWPILGDLLVQKLNVPVGLVSVGWGGSAASQWGRSGGMYPRMAKVLKLLGRNGERAILWHQGETDMVLGTSTELYMGLLTTLIAQSREDAGWDVPWMIAGVSFMPAQSFGSGLLPKMKAVRRAQHNLADGKTVFEGPTTDDLVGPKWRHDTVHFGNAGLHEHAKRWADVIERAFFAK